MNDVNPGAGTGASDAFYLTTAIFYPSAQPALHSLFEAIGADVLARYHRLLGEDTRFLTGLDEHSANVERMAQRAGRRARATLIDPWAASWRHAFDAFAISYDRFMRTTDPDHAPRATEMVRRAQAAGDIYKGTYSGWYCTGCNEFKTDAQLVDGRCPDHPTLEIQWLEEENYFFRAEPLPGRLEQLYAREPVILRAGALPQRGARLAQGGAAATSPSAAPARTGASRFPATPTTASTSGSTP